jgi:hypothetical protein
LSGRPWLRFGVVAGGMFAACQFSHGQWQGDGSSQPPDAGMCTSLSTECVGDSLRYCMEVGGSAMDIPCGWGCESGPPPRCRHVIPSGSGGVETNGVTAADVAGDMLLPTTLLGGETLDSDNGRIGITGDLDKHHSSTEGIENGIDFRFRGPISMWRFGSLTINGTITVIGARPVALVSDGEVIINGVVNASGICSGFIAGPGGGSGGSNESQAGFPPVGITVGGGSGATLTSGGGGGGHGSNGGDGVAAQGGVPYGDVEIKLLVGGAGGGAGGGGANYGRGGGGGGALQIISNTRITVIGSGGINAGGCGGKFGTGNGDSGGGGGAGGAILLEAPIVTINGVLAANGGGGGGGGGGNATAGSNGRLDRMPAAGGLGDGTNEAGGAGAAAETPPGNGSNGTNPGGGGGAIGRIRINTRKGDGAMVSGATLSPGMADPQFSTGSAATR